MGKFRNAITDQKFQCNGILDLFSKCKKNHKIANFLSLIYPFNRFIPDVALVVARLNQVIDSLTEVENRH